MDDETKDLGVPASPSGSPLQASLSAAIPDAAVQRGAPIGYISSDTLMKLQDPDAEWGPTSPAKLWPETYRASRAIHPVYLAQQIRLSPETFEEKCERNARVQDRYDELMREGKHGHYETMFRVVREEVERARGIEREARESEGPSPKGEEPGGEATRPEAIAAQQQVEALTARLAAAERVTLQGGLSNEELREEWDRKLPGVEPTDRELSAFALGVEVGNRGARMYFDERNSARAQVEALTEQVETLTMQLAGCGVAAGQNTPASVKERIEPGNPYYSASYQAVCAAVDSEMQLRARAEAAEAQVETLRQDAERAKEQRK